MTTIDDQASMLEELDRKTCLDNAKNRPAGPAATGSCLWCDEPLEPEQRWCHGGECRDDWERSQRGRKKI